MNNRFFLKVCNKCENVFISDVDWAIYCPNCQGKPDNPDLMTILHFDGLGNDLLRDIETNEVLEVNWSKEKMREYINENEKHIEQLTAKNMKLKRKTKKLYKKMLHYKNLLGGFDD